MILLNVNSAGRVDHVTLHKQKTIFDILNSIHGCEAWGNKTKELYIYSLLNFRMISFLLFHQASQPSMNFNLSELIC